MAAAIFRRVDLYDVILYCGGLLWVLSLLIHPKNTSESVLLRLSQLAFLSYSSHYLFLLTIHNGYI